jgi:hypothetical protein
MDLAQDEEGQAAARVSLSFGRALWAGVADCIQHIPDKILKTRQNSPPAGGAAVTKRQPDRTILPASRISIAYRDNIHTDRPASITHRAEFFG